ncbi:hypothetical protein GCM10009646_59970 [Streptomyces aureus]
MRCQDIRQYAPLPQEVDDAGHLGSTECVGDGETADGDACGAVRTGAVVHQPDDAEPGHGEAHAPDGGGEEEGGGARGAQQGAIVRRGHDASLSPPGGTRHTGSSASECADPWLHLKPSSSGVERGRASHAGSVTGQSVPRFG